VVGLAECLAAELAPDAITVNAVCPGQVDTPMMGTFFRDRGALRDVAPEVIRNEVVGRIPAGRMASAAEIADVFVFLASPMAGYITGQSIIVDGGITVG
jgi:NAD(P)-dependent dehydrogenase (short-subunit alcohol dehydrogenase family)